MITLNSFVITRKKTIRSVWGRYFLILWLSALAVSAANPFGLDEIRPSTYALLASFVVFFVFGLKARVRARYSKPTDNIKFAIERTRRILNSRTYQYFTTFVNCVLGIYLYKYSVYLLAAGLEESRTARFELGGVFSSVPEAIFFTYAIGGGIWFVKFATAFSLVFPGVSRLSVATSVLACGMYLGFGGGRNILLELGLMALFLLAVRRTQTQKGTNHRVKLSLGLALVGAYVMSVIATFYRVMPDAGFNLQGFLDASSILMKHLIVYFVGSFRALQHALNNYGSLVDTGLGRLTLAGFDEIYALAFRAIGFETMPYSNYWGALLSQQIYIGPNVTFNALYTALFNFYFDFGPAGVPIIGYLFGAVCSRVLRTLRTDGGASILFQATFLFTCSMLTPLTWKLSSGAATAVLLFACVAGLYERRKGRRALRVQTRHWHHYKTL